MPQLATATRVMVGDNNCFGVKIFNFDQDQTKQGKQPKSSFNNLRRSDIELTESPLGFKSTTMISPAHVSVIRNDLGRDQVMMPSWLRRDGFIYE
jgi:hypothetical protein